MTFDDPQSRNEAILQNILGAYNQLLPPFSRIEVLLLELLRQTGETNEEIAKKLESPLDGSGEPDAGESGQILQTNGDGTTSWADPAGGSGLTDAMKDALLSCFANVAWADGVDGQAYYDALAAVLNPGGVESIEAVFDTTAEVKPGDPVDSLRPYLTVTATYSDGSAGDVVGYTLSGVLENGDNTITVTYDGKVTTFIVSISVVDPTPYLVYTTDDVNMTMTITNLNITKIVEDQLEELVIPDTINGYHVIIG